MPYAVTFALGRFSLDIAVSTPNPVIKPIIISSMVPVMPDTSKIVAAVIAANDAVINVPANSL